MPSVSILIPCHNAAKWIAQTMESALAQSWRDIEVIVVDDGSRDESFLIARSFAPRSARVFAQENRGAAAARNRAIAESRGEYLQYLDADDLLAPDKIEIQLGQSKSPGAVYSGRWGSFLDKLSEVRFDDENPLFADLSPREFILRYCRHNCMMHPAAWLVPRAVAERAGPWNESLSLNDDGEYFSRVVWASEGVRYCPGAVSYYRSVAGGRLSAARRRRHLESAFRVTELIVGQLLERDDGAGCRAAAAELYQRFAYDYYPSAPDLVDMAERRARALGGAVARAAGGRGFLLARRLFGWKAARRLQVAFGKFPGPQRQ